jgi:hypothetical protein
MSYSDGETVMEHGAETGWIFFGGGILVAILVPTYAALKGWCRRALANYERRHQKYNDG